MRTEAFHWTKVLQPHAVADDKYRAYWEYASCRMRHHLPHIVTPGVIVQNFIPIIMLNSCMHMITDFLMVAVRHVRFV